MDAGAAGPPADGGRGGGGDERDGAVPSSTARRVRRLAGLPVSFAGRSVADRYRRVRGADPAALAVRTVAANADQLFAVLGELRGGAMKLGQTLAVFETMIPAEVAGPYREALTRLQTQSPGMPASTVHRVLAEQLGGRWRERFSSFDDEAAGAASLGQVHRAVWHDGRDVAVKVQYPGADTALRSDLRTLKRFSGLLGGVLPGLDARSLIAEIAARTEAELDYRTEADNQRRYAAAMRDDPEVTVPAVVASAPTVLVQEWLDGVGLLRFAGDPATDAAERDRVAGALVEALFASPARVGLLHADPHPGNVLVLPDGRIGLIDFGAVADLPGGLPEILGRTLRRLADDDREGSLALAREAGFVTGDDGDEDVLRWVGGLADPLRGETFRFTEPWMRREGQRIIDPFGGAHRGTGKSLNLPPEYMQLLRVTGGWMSVLARLDVTVAARAMAEEWVPGFASG